MPSTRFTQLLRDQTVERIVADALKQRIADMKQTEDAVTRRVVMHICGDDNVFERIKTVPDGWLPMMNTIFVKARGLGTHLHLSESMPLPAYVYSMGGRGTPEVTGELADEIAELDAIRKDIDNEQRALRASVRVVLATFTTVEKFAAGWPEGYKHFPHEGLRGECANLPATRIEDLNAWIETLKTNQNA